jgi:hypothetical protein
MKTIRRKKRITKKNYPFGPIIATREYIVLVPGVTLADLIKKGEKRK